LIDADLKPHLHAYMAVVLKDLGGKAVLINGMPDHVHVLTYYPAAVSISDLLRSSEGRTRPVGVPRNVSPPAGGVAGRARVRGVRGQP
jgi:hypothetical protein